MEEELQQPNQQPAASHPTPAEAWDEYCKEHPEALECIEYDV